jgi:hypothetical protein
MMETLAALQDSPFVQWTLADPYCVQLLLSAHSVGMAIVVGVILVLSVRVLGFPRNMPVSIFHRALALAWWGFALNAASGLWLFATNGPQLLLLWTFQIKMALIAVGGISVWLMWRIARRHPDKGFSFAGREKGLAALSMLFWLGAITAGRYIAYTLPPR